MIGHLVVVGSANADLCFQIDRVPKAGETISAKSLETFPGGKVSERSRLIHSFPRVLYQGANQAAAAAKLGYPTYFIGQVNLVFPQKSDASDSGGVYRSDQMPMESF